MEDISHYDADTSLDIFIGFALNDCEETLKAIRSITPKLLNEWIANNELNPRPPYKHPVSFAIGKILLCNADRLIRPGSKEGLAKHLEPYRAKLDATQGDSALKTQVTQLIRIERLAYISQELGAAADIIRERER